jgi:Leucine-rich repeat (LRR) protein
MKFFVLTFVVLLNTLAHVSAAVSQGQIAGLEAFCTGVNCLSNPHMSDTWAFDKDGSGSYTSDPCTFIGVTCDTDGSNVVGLSLGGAVSLLDNSYPVPLVGSIAPETFSALPSLTTLLLSGNRLSGSIPEEMAQHTALDQVDLSNNQLTGCLPEYMGNMTALTALDASLNFIDGTLPAGLPSMLTVETVKLANNKLGGTIPSNLLEALTASLTTLDLNNNMFTGALPVAQTDLTNAVLTTFKVGNNYLEGDIPMYNANLDQLDISGNTALDVAGCADNMKDILRLSVTVFNCQIPDSIVNNDRTTLYLSNWYKEGTEECPTWYGNMFDDKFCEPLYFCPISGDTIATWGAVTSGKLEQFGLIAGFNIDFTSAAVEALVDETKGNNVLQYLLLSAVPHGDRFVRNTIYSGLPGAVYGAAVNRLQTTAFPDNIGSLTSLTVLIAAYGSQGQLYMGDGTADDDYSNLMVKAVTTTLPASMKTMSGLKYLAVPNEGQVVFAGMNTAPLFDPEGVIEALTPTLTTLDIRGNCLYKSFDSMFNITLTPGAFSMKYALLGGNNIMGGYFLPTLVANQQLASMYYLDISNNKMTVDVSGLALTDNTPMLGHWISSNSGLYGSLPSFPPSLITLEVSGCNFTTGFSDMTGMDRVRSIAMAENNMTGNLPDAAQFSYSLSYFGVKRNMLSGAVPADYGKMKNARWMSLGTNRFSGPLPTFSTEECLQVFGIEQNQFSGGGLFAALTGLTNLRQLYANNIPTMGGGGTTPNTWSDSLLTNTGLQVLNLQAHGLSGAFPNTLEDFAYLEAVMIGNNELTGVVQNCGLQEDTTGRDAEAGGGFNMLDVIGISTLDCYGLCWFEQPVTYLNRDSGESMCEGTIQSIEMDTLKELSDLYQLSATSLDWNFGMDSSGNYVDNPCTSKWSGITCGANDTYWVISEIDLSNQLSNASATYEMATRQVNLPDTLPSILSTGFQYLKSLDLSSNHLTGKIPASDAWPTSLETLKLGDNMLTGEVPWAQLCALPNLDSIDVHANKLSGSLPEAAFTDFVSVQGAGNLFWGTIPEVAAGVILPVNTLDLRSNQIAGTIPASYISAMNCQSGVFEKFLMSSNNLAGTVPAALGAPCLAMSLKQLWLDDNMLSGSIPDLNALGSLEVLMLQNNKFVGPLPDMSEMYSLVALGFELTDDVPHIPYASFPGETNTELMYISTRRADGAIPATCLTKLSASGTYGLGLVGGFNGLIPQDVMDSLGSLEDLMFLGFSSRNPTIGNSLTGAYVPKATNRNPNTFQGIIPASTNHEWDQKLTALDLSGNLFTGPVPPVAFSGSVFKSMSSWNFAYNGFSTVEFSATSMNFVGTLDISNNPALGGNTPNLAAAIPERLFYSITADNCGFSGALDDTACDILSYPGGVGIFQATGNHFSCYAQCFGAMGTSPGLWFNVNKGIPICSGSTSLAPTQTPTIAVPTAAPTHGGGGTSSSGGDADGLSSGAIVGIAFGGIFGVILIGAVVYLYFSNKNALQAAERARQSAASTNGLSAAADNSATPNPLQAPPAPVSPANRNSKFGGRVSSTGNTTEDVPAALNEL